MAQTTEVDLERMRLIPILGLERARLWSRLQTFTATAVTPEEAADTSIQGRRKIIEKLQLFCAIQHEKRGRGSWTYDYISHSGAVIRLRKEQEALDAELARFANATREAALC